MKLIPTNKLLIQDIDDFSFEIIDPRWKWDKIWIKNYYMFFPEDEIDEIKSFLDKNKIKYNLYPSLNILGFKNHKLIDLISIKINTIK